MHITTALPNKSLHIPALTEHPLLRYFNFIVLYVAQGIPEGMLFFGIPAWMAANGKTPGRSAALWRYADCPGAAKL